MKKQNIKTLWGNAFSGEPDASVIAFTAGRDVLELSPADIALIPFDLWVNKAHCVMLAKTKIIPKNDAVQILSGLLALEKLVKDKSFQLDPTKEDVHTNIESWLTDTLGIEVAGKIHTARSRNDQIATDMKLYLRDQVLLLVQNTVGLVQSILGIAETYKGLPFPGFTHHQHAMVTTFGHVLASFASMILRDIQRIEMWFSIHNQNPLGSAASYGTSFPIDRKMTSKYLGFDGPDDNSLDAITNRWESEADVAFAVCALMNHLSLISEMLMILATPEFGMIKLADQYSTGSSIMPQKKNPDPLEVIKGKAGFAQGQLVSLLSIGKGNFIGYNRDSQWTKYIVMDLLRECLHAPVVLSGIFNTLTVDKASMETWCHKNFIGTTTLMEQMVQTQNISMRQAKIIVEKAVKKSLGKDKVQLGDPSWQEPQMIIALAKSYGGPGKNSMKTSLKKMKKKILHHTSWLLAIQKQKADAINHLSHQIETMMKGGE